MPCRNRTGRHYASARFPAEFKTGFVAFLCYSRPAFGVEQKNKKNILYNYIIIDGSTFSSLRLVDHFLSKFHFAYVVT
jgi:hypothetical protein